MLIGPFVAKAVVFVPLSEWCSIGLYLTLLTFLFMLPCMKHLFLLHNFLVSLLVLLWLPSVFFLLRQHRVLLCYRVLVDSRALFFSISHPNSHSTLVNLRLLLRFPLMPSSQPSLDTLILPDNAVSRPVKVCRLRLSPCRLEASHLPASLIFYPVLSRSHLLRSGSRFCFSTFSASVSFFVSSLTPYPSSPFKCSFPVRCFCSWPQMAAWLRDLFERHLSVRISA